MEFSSTIDNYATYLELERKQTETGLFASTDVHNSKVIIHSNFHRHCSAILLIFAKNILNQKISEKKKTKLILHRNRLNEILYFNKSYYDEIISDETLDLTWSQIAFDRIHLAKGHAGRGELPLQKCIFTLEEILDYDFWPTRNRLYFTTMHYHRYYYHSGVECIHDDEGKPVEPEFVAKSANKSGAYTLDLQLLNALKVYREALEKRKNFTAEEPFGVPRLDIVDETSNLIQLQELEEALEKTLKNYRKLRRYSNVEA